MLKMTIEELDLSVRSFNCLKRANINTVEDLVSKTQDEMIKVRNLGRKSLESLPCQRRQQLTTCNCSIRRKRNMPGTRKLGKTTSQRMAMLRQQVTDFLDTGRMETTVTRCKEIAPLAEKMITLGKAKDLAAYRQALSFITREDVAKKVFDEIAPKYADRNGGYTRITRIGARRGDIELV